MARRVSAFGERPGSDGRAALHDLFKPQDLYSTSALTVKPYGPSKFTVTSSGIVATSLYGRLPTEGQALMGSAAECRRQPVGGDRRHLNRLRAADGPPRVSQVQRVAQSGLWACHWRGFHLSPSPMWRGPPGRCLQLV